MIDTYSFYIIGESIDYSGNNVKGEQVTKWQKINWNPDLIPK